MRWMRWLEAKEWLARIRAKRPAGFAAGQAMVEELIADIAKRRSQEAAQELRDLINAARRASAPNRAATSN